RHARHQDARPGAWWWPQAVAPEGNRPGATWLDALADLADWWRGLRPASAVVRAEDAEEDAAAGHPLGFERQGCWRAARAGPGSRRDRAAHARHPGLARGPAAGRERAAHADRDRQGR